MKLLPGPVSPPPRSPDVKEPEVKEVQKKSWVEDLEKLLDALDIGDDVKKVTKLCVWSVFIILWWLVLR